VPGVSPPRALAEFSLTVVGAWYRGPEAIRLMKATARNGGAVIFEKEQYNRYDENAFKAYCVGRNNYLKHVAYMNREDAARVANMITRGQLDIEWPGKKDSVSKYIVCVFEDEYDLKSLDSDKTVLWGKVKPIALMNEDELDDYIAELDIDY
jgi:ABC-type transport system substrate-binding protein